MLTEKDYCDYSLLRSLIGIGYPKYRILDTGFRILLYDAQKWLREEKNISVFPERNSFGWYCGLHRFENNVERICYPFDEVSSYEEALLEGIKEAVKLLKEEK